MGEQVYESIFAPINVPQGLSISQFLVQYNPDDTPADKVIVEDFEGGRTVTYGGLREEAATGAAGLTATLGLGPGDVVAIYATNSVDYVVLAHSVLWFGGIVAGINPLASTHDLVHYIGSCEPKVIFADPSLRSRMDEAVSKYKSPNLQPVVVDLGGSSAKSFPSFFEHRHHGHPPMPPFDLTGKNSREHVSAILFSSGTSGKPKAVQWSHSSMIAQLLSSRAAQPELQNGGVREVFYAPFAHMFGLLGAVICPAYLGSYVLAMKRFEYRAYIEGCARIKATVMKMVPPTALAISKDPEIRKYDMSSVDYILCAGATLQVEVVHRLQELMKGCYITQGYGLSEAAVSGLKPSRSADKSGSVGRLFPSNRLRIVDDNLNDVPQGEPGEALIKGPTVFMSYKGNPEATAETFHNGWLRTGDVVAMDTDGFLWFHDRKKEMIKYKGNQVAPAELEDILSSHPDVLEAAVCGVFDASQQTEIPVGYVHLKDSIPEKQRQQVCEGIRKWVDGIVSPTKKLRGGVFYLPAIPKNPTGKVMRAHLPARLEAAAKAKAAMRAAKL
ncbi:acyl-CoA synthetases/AMP-acid ligases II [Lepidopterella palustris CBS 459.81]|uniref:Acyl-CoA synthetases/AMP-acid ligases II n=1 Tax=Lepidopterella palustris CBS 459.81 TaxID=1314670 RepID=A0A8E2EBI7_9PEZI|nr:acyl-CoA synthetases/AMP-acid ligases II [Lepidopterella palustris CBS 459.81]